MSTGLRAPRVRKSDIANAIAAMEASGLHPTGLELHPDGTVKLLTAASGVLPEIGANAAVDVALEIERWSRGRQ